MINYCIIFHLPTPVYLKLSVSICYRPSKTINQDKQNIINHIYYKKRSIKTISQPEYHRIKIYILLYKLEKCQLDFYQKHFWQNILFCKSSNSSNSPPPTFLIRRFLSLGYVY